MFENQTIEFKELPKYEEVTLQPLHLLYKKVVIFNSVITLAVATAISLALYFFIDDVSVYTYFYIPFVVGVLLTIHALFAYNKKCYAFRQHDVLYQSGVLTNSVAIIPYIRLQHVVVKQSWYAKRLNLATLQLHTAANDNVDITIPGLTLEEANQWKEYVLNRIQVLEDESEA